MNSNQIYENGSGHLIHLQIYVSRFACNRFDANPPRTHFAFYIKGYWVKNWCGAQRFQTIHISKSQLSRIMAKKLSWCVCELISVKQFLNGSLLS